MITQPERKSFSNTRKFFRSATQTIYPKDLISQDALDSISEQEMISRNWQIVYGYIEYPGTLTEVAKSFGLCRERGRQIFHDTLYLIWKRSPVEVQQQFPFSGLTLRKPVERLAPPQPSSPSFKLAQLIKQGKTFEDAAKELKLVPSQAYQSSLNKLGVKVLRQPQKKDLQLKNHQLSDEQTRNLFQKITYTDYQFLRAKGRVLPLSRVLRIAGANYHPHTLKFLALEIDQRMPVGIIDRSSSQTGNLFYILDHHLPRAFAVISEVSKQKNQDWKARERREIYNCYLQIAGPTIIRPTVTNFRDPHQYLPVSAVLKEADINYKKFKIPNLLGMDCPVPVFMLQNNYRFSIQDREKLKQYFLEKPKPPLNP